MHLQKSLFKVGLVSFNEIVRARRSRRNHSNKTKLTVCLIEDYRGYSIACALINSRQSKGTLHSRKQRVQSHNNHIWIIFDKLLPSAGIILSIAACIVLMPPLIIYCTLDPESQDKLMNYLQPGWYYTRA